jgi:hypothetical protein
MKQVQNILGYILKTGLLDIYYNTAGTLWTNSRSITITSPVNDISFVLLRNTRLNKRLAADADLNQAVTCLQILNTPTSCTPGSYSWRQGQNDAYT